MAAKAQVVDDAGFFSPEAVNKANQPLAEIEQKTGKQLRVETHAQIPAELRGQYTPEKRNEFFTRWAEQRGREEGINGALVLVNRDPPFVQTAVGDQTLKSGVFTTADRDRMRDILVGAFQAKNYDAGLLSAVEYWRQKVGSADPAARGDEAGAAAATDGAAARSSTPQPYRFPNDSRAQSQSPAGSEGTSPAPTRVPQRRGIGFGTILVWGILIFLGLMLLRRLLGGRRQQQQPRLRRRPGYDPRTGQPVDQGYDPRYGGQGGRRRRIRNQRRRRLARRLARLLDRPRHVRRRRRQRARLRRRNRRGARPAPHRPLDRRRRLRRTPARANDFGGGGDSGGGGDFGGGGDVGGGGDF